MAPMSQVIDLTQETQVIDLTQEEEEEITYVNEPVTSILLTYPRVLDQFRRNGLELQDDGSVCYMQDDQLCRSGSVKDFFLCQILQLDPVPAHVCVAMEDHKDGTPHIHMFVQWCKSHRFGPKYFDFGGIHPNVVYLNSPIRGKRYCTKFDKHYLRWVKTITTEDEIPIGFFPEVPPPYE